MPALGVALLLAGALLVVAEAHMPSGALGVLGGLALIMGGIVAIVAAGGSAALAVPVGLALGGGAGGWTLFVARRVAASRRSLGRSGADGLSGRVGVVRSWSGIGGQVFVDGALWRAQREPFDTDPEAIHDGDRVVVEYVRGLTVCVRHAEEWELNG
jgi:membrane-bound serine protease (ClpP class)